MASSANPDPWSGLSGFGSSEGATSDARAALLRINAEMFVAAPARDRESIDTFEALVLGFLPRADSATLAELARILAPCEDTPASILDHLARHAPPVGAVHRSGEWRHELVTAKGRLRLARRSGIAAPAADRLLVLGEEPVEDALAGNPDLPPGCAPFATLLQRARHRPALAGILLARPDLGTMDKAALYLAADRARRHAIRERVAALLARRRVTLACRLSQHDVADLLAASRKGDDGRFEALLTAALGFPATTEWRLLRIGRHRLLALALKALGVSRRDGAQILLTLHPALSHPLSAFKELLREMRDVPEPVALSLVEAILGVRALSGEGGAH